MLAGGPVQVQVQERRRVDPLSPQVLESDSINVEIPSCHRITLEWSLDKNWSDEEASFMPPDGQVRLLLSKFFDQKLLADLKKVLPDPPEGKAIVAKTAKEPSKEELVAKAKKQRVKAKAQAARLKKQSLGCLVATT